jgi:hypothetical protein
MSDGSPRVGRGERVAWLDLADRDQDALYVTTLPDGPPLVLRESAALIFLVATEGGTLEDVVARVAEQAAQPPEAIRSDVVAFVDELLRLGLLSRR